MLNIYKAVTISSVMFSSVCIAAESNPSQDQNKLFSAQTFLVNARADQTENVKDPLQGMNRVIYTFNDKIDQSVLRPAAVLYSTTVPEPAQGAYTNFRKNLKEPWNAVNQLLQGKPLRSVKTLSRFTINTLTSLGFADTARHLKLSHQEDSLGTTFGVWGMPSGPYIVLPFLGSSTFRDGLGMIPGSYAHLQSYIIGDDKLLIGNMALEATATRAQYLSIDSVIRGDKYAAMRDVYLQQRAFEIAQKRGEDISQSMFAEDPFEDEVLDEEFEEDIELEPETTQ